MLKAKTVALDDSNIAHLGGKEEHDARTNAAKGEAAFKAAGQNAGIEIWRIEKMLLKSWPKEKYGTFFSGDSYLVLNTMISDTGKKSWNVYSWQGTSTSIDERTVSAYKMVELDDILGGAPIQHREVESCESATFCKLFKQLIVMDGGVATGFNHLEPTSYAPRLLHIKGKRKNIRVSQVELSASSMNHGDVFILDNGLDVMQWNGSASGPFEKRKGADVVNAITSDRAKAKSIVCDGDEAQFWDIIDGSYEDVKSASEGGDDVAVVETEKCIFRLSDASGSLTFEKIASGSLSKDSLESKDVFIVDTGIHVFVWVGKDASPDEKKNAMIFAEKYLVDQGRPSGTPITRVLDGAEEYGEEFDDAFE